MLSDIMKHNSIEPFYYQAKTRKKTAMNSKNPIYYFASYSGQRSKLHIFHCRTVESLTAQFRKNPKCFFILTNSRSLSSEKVKISSCHSNF